MNAVPNHIQFSAQPSVGEVVVTIGAVALGQLARHGRAGIVVATDKLATRLRTGDRIVISPSIDNSQYTNSIIRHELTVPERNCHTIRADISVEQAAAIASAHLTAWHLIVNLARLTPGEIILILGFSDPVAVAALQIAVQRGAHVVAASDNQGHLASAKALGAEHGINWAIADLAKELRSLTGKHGADVAVNSLGGESWSQTLACLARGGRLVTAGARAGAQPQTDLRRIFWNHLQIFGTNAASADDFEAVLRYIETTRTQPVIDSVFTPTNTNAAEERFQSGAAFGNVVVSI